MSKKMILPLVGGLGNQMFIVAAGLYLTLHEGAQVTFKTPQTFRDQRQHRVHTDVTRTRFFDSQQLLVASSFDRATVALARVEKLVRRALFGVQPRGFLYFQETHVDNWKDELEAGFGRVNFAYFQTKFFLNELRSFGYLNDIYLDLESTNSIIQDACAIHVRRGDYLLPQNASGIGVLDHVYFTNAALKMRMERGINRIDVFSDFIESPLVHQLSKLGFEVEVKSTINPTLDLSRLSSYETQILSNSSFSWWAANLCRASYVIAPSPWFKGMPVGDIYQTDWLLEESLWT